MRKLEFRPEHVAPAFSIGFGTFFHLNWGLKCEFDIAVFVELSLSAEFKCIDGNLGVLVFRFLGKIVAGSRLVLAGLLPVISSLVGLVLEVG